MEETELKLTHFDEDGRAVMVDVGGKAQTHRVAVATGRVRMKSETLQLIKDGKASKGDVLCVAEVAGIMAAKKTSDLIPMCHPLFLTKASIRFELQEADCAVFITATAETIGVTGVEMEALTAVSIAALTIYDMCKAVDKGMVIEEIALQKKSGGKSGDFYRQEEKADG